MSKYAFKESLRILDNLLNVYYDKEAYLGAIQMIGYIYKSFTVSSDKHILRAHRFDVIKWL